MANNLGYVPNSLFGSYVFTQSTPTFNTIGLDDGKVSEPAIKFNDDTDTGLYSSANNVINFVTSGTNRLTLNTVSLTSTLPIYIPYGTVDNPSISFANDVNTGIYATQADELCITTNGVQRVLCNAFQFYVNCSQLVKFVGGTEFAPDYTFANDTDSGLFTDGTGNSIGLSAGGGARIRVTTSAITNYLPLLAPNGSAAAPSYSFANDTNTGIFYTGTADTMALTTGGTQRFTLDTASVTSTLPFLGPNGSATAPCFSFSGDPNTGLYQTGTADTLALTTGGVARLTVSTSWIAATLTLQATAGSATAPGFSFSNDPNTGIWQTGTADTMGFSTGGTNRLTLDTLNFTTTLPFRIANGSASGPAITWSGDNDTGIFWSTTDTIGFSAGGTSRMTVSSSAVTTTVPILIPDGTHTAPGLAFSADTNVGIFRPSADTIRISAANTASDVYAFQVTNTFGIASVHQNDQYNVSSTINMQVYGDGFNEDVITDYVSTASTTAYNHVRLLNNGGNAWRVRGDGATFADGAYSSGGADYAEYFESSDGKEIPVGSTVCLDGTTGKIKLAQAGDEANIIGVVRPKNSNSSIVIGNSAEDYWNQKFEKDEYGQFVYETVEYWKWTVPAYTDEKEVYHEEKYHAYYSNQVPDGIVVSETKQVETGKQMKKLNPSYDPALSYTPRSNRPEWHIIGMMGQVPVKNGQVLGSSWKLMKNIGDGSVAKMYLVK